MSNWEIKLKNHIGSLGNEIAVQKILQEFIRVRNVLEPIEVYGLQLS